MGTRRYVSLRLNEPVILKSWLTEGRIQVTEGSTALRIDRELGDPHYQVTTKEGSFEVTSSNVKSAELMSDEQLRKEFEQLRGAEARSATVDDSQDLPSGEGKGEENPEADAKTFDVRTSDPSKASRKSRGGGRSRSGPRS